MDHVPGADGWTTGRSARPGVVGLLPAAYSPKALMPSPSESSAGSVRLKAASHEAKERASEPSGLPPGWVEARQLRGWSGAVPGLMATRLGPEPSASSGQRPEAR